MNDDSGFIVFILIIGVVLVVMIRRARPRLSACGTAMFATRDMLRKAGMLNAPSGLILGYTAEPEERSLTKPSWEKKPPLVRLPAAIHTAIFSPAGGGKSTGCVIPFLLTCGDESCVCVDFKGELALHTAAARAAMGHRVVILDPFNAVTATLNRPSDRFDPVDFIDPNNPLGLDEALSAASAMVIREGEDGKTRHFNEYAELSIGAGIAVTAAYGDMQAGTRSIQNVADMINGPEKWKLAQELMKKSAHWSGMLARMGNSLGFAQGEELSSIRSVTARHLRFLNTPAVAENTRESTFNPSLLKRGKMTIYLVMPPKFMREYAGLLRLWIDSLLKACIREGLDESRKVHFVIDEAAQLMTGGMKSINDALALFRGYGVRLQLYWQSTGQLKAAFPEDQGQSMMSNTTQVFFATNDLETATYISRRCGNFTNVVESGGTNQGKSEQWSHGAQPGSTSKSWGSNTGWQQQPRELLKPEEVLAQPPRLAITFVAGMYPIRTWLLRWFEEPWLAAKVTGKVAGRSKANSKALAAMLIIVFTVVAFIMLVK